MPRHAVVYTAHIYLAGAPTCKCPEADEHAPCAECGSSRDSFIHDPEAAATGAMLTVVSDEDTGTAAETTG
jgi:hypothetical protein